MKIFPSEKIYTDESKILNMSVVTNSGRGVFAKNNIKKGVLIENCPIIIIPASDTSNLTESILVTYFLYFGNEGEKLALMLGFGSLYNHSDKPNIKHKINEKDKTISFLALKNIKKDEELTFNYRSDTKIKSPLWFELENKR